MEYARSDLYNPNVTVTMASIGSTVVIETRTWNGSYTMVTLGLGDLFDLAAELSNHLVCYYRPAKAPAKKTPPSCLALTRQAQLLFRHMNRAGSISAREAMADYGITSATLARRICDIEAEGFQIRRDRRVHPITGKRYTRYSLDGDYTIH